MAEQQQIDQLHQWLGDEWTTADRKVDFSSADGTQIIEVRLASRGVRDLHAALMQLALLVAENPQVERAYLIARLPRMTRQRAKDEWERALRTLRPDAAGRLVLVGIGADGTTTLPEDDAAKRLAVLVDKAFRQGEAKQTRTTSTPPLSAKSFDVWKVLLGAWLAREGPLLIGEVADRAGCSYPTVAKTLRRLHQRGEIERDTSRSVELHELPRATLREVLALADTLRRPAPFIDATGGDPNPQSLLRRLQAKMPPRVALSGVVAARHYNPQLDLHGLPRLDVIMHEPIDLDWVQGIDPALRQAPPIERAPALVIRSLTRPTAGFKVVDDYALPIADPVETLLDLLELRLDAQAADFVKAMRDQGDGRERS